MGADQDSTITVNRKELDKIVLGHQKDLASTYERRVGETDFSTKNALAGIEGGHASAILALNEACGTRYEAVPSVLTGYFSKTRRKPLLTSDRE